MNIKNCLVVRLKLGDNKYEKNYFVTLVDNGKKTFIQLDEDEPYFRDTIKCQYYSCEYINDPKEILEILKVFKRLPSKKTIKVKEFLSKYSFNINDIMKNSKIFKLDIDKFVNINSKEFLSENLNPDIEEVIELHDFLMRENMTL